MRKVILCLLILILIPVVLAKTEEAELRGGESYMVDGRNITLLKLNKPGKNVVICVNNKKEIISDYKYTNGINIDLKWVREDRAKFEFRFSECEDCDFGNWDNLDCFDGCNIDKDCDDNNEETLDKCDGRPKKCVNKIIEVEKEEVKIEEEKKVEEKKSEEIKTEEILEEAPKKSYKSFTQWLYELIFSWFK